MINTLSGVLGMVVILGLAHPIRAQSGLQQSSQQICDCLEESVKSDTLKLNKVEILAQCTGETMAKNRIALSGEPGVNMGTVEGIIQLRDRFIALLYEDCQQFRVLFIDENKED